MALTKDFKETVQAQSSRLQRLPARVAERRSTITCPHCGHRRAETMPTNACQFFYDCTGCGALLRPKPGDCCVFCSYGTVPCPPVQEARQTGRGSCCVG